MSRKQLIYAVVLGVAVVAFAIDKLFLGEPQAAVAKPSPLHPKAPALIPTTPEAPAQTATGDPSLAWLEKLAASDSGRDVFAPSPEWVAVQQKKREEATAAKAEKGPRPGSPEAFETSHKLQATTVMGNSGLAVVDGQCLIIGDTLDGFRLVRVQADQVEFRRGGERAVLSLPMPPGAGMKNLSRNSSGAGAPPMDSEAPGTNTKGPETSPSDHHATVSSPTTRPTPGSGLLRLLWGGTGRDR